MLLSINVVFLENEPLSCLEWLSELRTTTEQQQIVKIEYFTRLKPLTDATSWVAWESFG